MNLRTIYIKSYNRLQKQNVVKVARFWHFDFKSINIAIRINKLVKPCITIAIMVHNAGHTAKMNQSELLNCV